MDRRKKTILAAVLTFFAWIAAASALSPYDYAERGPEGEKRMEGTVPVPVSGYPDLALVSFLAKSLKENPGQPVVLKLAFYMPRDGQLFIKAQPNYPEKLYFMRPEQVRWEKGWKKFSRWPVDDVLVHLDISPENLCVLGRLDRPDDGSGDIVPLVLYAKKPLARISGYQLVFRPGRDLRRLVYELHCLESGQETTVATHYNLLKKNPVDLDLDMSGMQEGYFRLVVTGKYKNSTEEIYRSYRFYHQPSISFTQ